MPVAQPENWVRAYRKRRILGGIMPSDVQFAMDPNIALTAQGGTLTRGGVANYFDINGVLQQAASGVERSAHYINGVRTHLFEPAATNIVTQPRDCTNAGWTKSNVTAAKDQTGIDGSANVASSLVATAGNGTCLFAATLASSTRCASVYIKRITGTGTISFTTDGGTTYTDITSQINSTSYSRVFITQAAVTNPSTGFKIVTNGDKIAVDYVQNETGLYATTPISGSRVADVMYVPVDATQEALAIYARWRHLVDPTQNGTYLFSLTTSGNANPRLIVQTEGSAQAPREAYLNAAGTTKQVQDSIDPPSGWALNDTIEMLLQLDRTGLLTGYMTRNGNGFPRNAATAQALDGTGGFWGGASTGGRLYLGSSGAGGTPTPIALTSLLVLRGEKRTMRDMLLYARTAL